MPDYVAVCHIYLSALDDVGSVIAADDVKLALERDILEDDESIDIVQVIPLGADVVPSSQVMQLHRARNILLRTRTKEGYDLGSQLDQFAHALSQRLEPYEAQTNYDYSSYMQVARDVYKGGNPL